MIAIARQEANAFFYFINALHERTSFIITTNKSPKEWAETISDEVITTALLDRLLYRCEIIKLKGESHRMKHRKTIFEKTKLTSLLLTHIMHSNLQIAVHPYLPITALRLQYHE